jgi:hypothetical protein
MEGLFWFRITTSYICHPPAHELSSGLEAVLWGICHEMHAFIHIVLMLHEVIFLLPLLIPERTMRVLRACGCVECG